MRTIIIVLITNNLDRAKLAALTSSLVESGILDHLYILTLSAEALTPLPAIWYRSLAV